MLWKWLPWQYMVRRAARAHGFIDPMALLARLQGFAQPSEVAEPIELLRAGVVFHARGLINSRVIQHNRDWVWPYWVERQFDPKDISFVPRAFSITHVNLSQRNWTAVGMPDNNELPIVDARGLLTPFFDGWSLDAWVMSDDGRILLPSRVSHGDKGHADQSLELGDGLAVVTRTNQERLSLITRAEVAQEGGRQICRQTVTAEADAEGWVIVTLRPYNPEGVSLVQKVRLSGDRRSWSVEGGTPETSGKTVVFDQPADRHHVSPYGNGDVYIHLNDLSDETAGECDVGMLTVAALFRLQPGAPKKVVVDIPLEGSPSSVSWSKALEGHCRLTVPDVRFQRLYDTAIRSLVLHSSEDIYPGPYTYKRFWFRDAAFIIHALLCAGLTDRAERSLDRFPSRQKANGYYHSQDGEWDSNGEAIWILERFCRMTNRKPKSEWWESIKKGARWIGGKRLKGGGDELHAGLLPAGFSAEHLGPNDYYYWDDFWGLAGLQAAMRMAASLGDSATRAEFSCEAGAFAQAIDRSLEKVRQRLKRPALPAAPGRRLDAGAVGSLVLSYPLALCPPRDERALDTAEYLMDACFVDGAFFQDMIHSGLNAYLTLHVAQVLLRGGDPRYWDLMRIVANLASPTGQWPEAIHPHSGGGCMGDGQHIWAAAEWVLMVRNCFLREEEDMLVLCSGVPQEWLGERPVSLGPAPTTFGTVTVTAAMRNADEVEVTWQADWHDGKAPPVQVRLPGYDPVEIGGEAGSVIIGRVGVAS
ncbi:hypothetical protein [Telmatospirillum sp. J64-1]|uniref:hypothetical protein n=1 Tax=Telmatospirillum sp. J64-1 TaxID=2502183 RepID=UPI00115C7C68|nr:hypothetical protein [Telmatospirillum sp. J64-1]